MAPVKRLPSQHVSLRMHGSRRDIIIPPISVEPCIDRSRLWDEGDMNRFEFVMVAVGIMLGMSLTQALRGLGSVVRSRSRYSALTVWLVVLLFQHLVLWWSLWDLTFVSHWTISSFLLVTLVPCSLFAATDALAPVALALDLDAREHFHRVSPWFYSLLLVYVVCSVLWTWLLTGLELDHFLRVLEAAAGLAIVMGLAWRDRNVHGIAAVVYLIMLVVGQVMFRPYLAGG